MAKSDSERRIDVAAAKKQYARRPKAQVTMDEISAVYGLTKPAMHNLHKTVEDFPNWTERKGNSHFYPAHKVFKALLGYLERKEKAAASQAAAFSELVRTPGATPDGSGQIEPLTATEQLKAFDLRNRLREEAIADGVLHRADHCAAVSDRVFSRISSRFGSGLADLIDPNGLWPGELRAAVNKAGEQLTLDTFEDMKHMLTAGVVGLASNADGKASGLAQPARAGRRPVARRVSRSG